MATTTMLNAVATASPTYSDPQTLRSPNFSYGVKVAGTGAVTATVILQWCNDGSSWKTFATFSLSGTTTALDGDVYSAAYQYIRSGVTAISGTGAAVTDTLNVP